jgi:hypothetical protein
MKSREISKIRKKLGNLKDLQNIITQYDDKLKDLCAETTKPRLKVKRVSIKPTLPRMHSVQTEAETQTSVENLSAVFTSIPKESTRYEAELGDSFETFGRTQKPDWGGPVTNQVSELNDTVLDEESVELLDMFEEQKERSYVIDLPSENTKIKSKIMDERD